MVNSIRLSPIFLSILLLSATANQAHAALSAKTANTIQGTGLYLSFNGGSIHATDLKSLFSVELSDGSIIDTSTTSFTLPNASDTFASVKAIVTADNQPVNLTSLISSKMYDADGDSNPLTNTATGSIKVRWEDKNGNVISDSSVRKPSICLSPYKLILDVTPSDISTEYDDPRTTVFSTTTQSHTYTITLTSTVGGVCYAKPDMTFVTGDYLGPTSMWDTNKGFKLQSESNYSQNFPTTGANGLYFDLEISGVSSTLTWSPVTVNGITATMSGANNTKVTVTLTGPTSSSPSAFISPTEMVLQGKDSLGSVVVEYGFQLQKWFISRGTTKANFSTQSSWCTTLNGSYYKLPILTDLSNGQTGGTVSAGRFKRAIGGGLFSEWGGMNGYSSTGFASGPNSYHWSTSMVGSNYVLVAADNGYVRVYGAGDSFWATCVSN